MMATSMTTKIQRARGLTVVEVLLVIVSILVVVSVFFPTMQGSKHRAPSIQCTSNLKQVGLAFLIWANDHEAQFPQVSTNSAGSLAWADSPQVFRHFQAISSELVTPKVLVCPSDAKRKRADDFEKFANINISYFIALDADGSKPQRLLSGDRNVTGGTLSNGFLRTLTSNAEAGWTTELHNRNGNVGLSDGSVNQVTETGLQGQLQAGDLNVIRLAIP